MAQGRSTKFISMIKLVRTSRLSIKNSLSDRERRCAGAPMHRCGCEDRVLDGPASGALVVFWCFVLNPHRRSPYSKLLSGGKGSKGRNELDWVGVDTLSLWCFTPTAVYNTYRGTSLIRNSPPLGPYSRPMPRALWWS